MYALLKQYPNTSITTTSQRLSKVNSNDLEYQVYTHSVLDVLYSGKVWQALNMANWISVDTGEFKFGDLN